MINFGGLRTNAICPKCGSFERHRLQYLVLKDKVTIFDRDNLRLLHFAPEPYLRKLFAASFPHYETADLYMKDVDHTIDLRDMPFHDCTYDFVIASHVLEHIVEDHVAIKEIHRILRPGGIAVLPVPIVAATTIEYPYANPFEGGHVRAPGPDYFEKYKICFSRVDVYGSDCFPEQFQTYTYEDRTCWPTPECPWRLPMQGSRHIDLVPVCYA